MKTVFITQDVQKTTEVVFIMYNVTYNATMQV